MLLGESPLQRAPNERLSELAFLHEIQRGMANAQDSPTIVDMVGERLRQLLKMRLFRLGGIRATIYPVPIIEATSEAASVRQNGSRSTR
jgi:hypothetical protein